MIMYTPIPLEQVFEGMDLIKPPTEITIDGITMQVELLSSIEARVVRILSPHAEDYLHPVYAPGNLIQLQTNRNLRKNML